MPDRENESVPPPAFKRKTSIRGWASLAKRRAAILLASLSFTIIMLHSWVLPLGAIWYQNGSVMDDPAQSAWGLWHFNESVIAGQNPYFTKSIFYPVGAHVLHPTSSEGSFPVTFLTKVLMGGDSAYPFYAYRIIILLWFALLLYFSYSFLRVLDITVPAAATAAIAYAFSRFFIDHTPHLNVLAGFFIPLVALLLVRLYKRPSPASLFAAPVTMALALYFTEFLFHILLGVGCLLVLILLFPEGRKDIFGKLGTLGWRRVVLAVALFILLITPAVLKQSSANVVRPAAIESSDFSANLAALVLPNQQRTPLYGGLFVRLLSRGMAGVDGHEVFIGFPLLVFGVVGLVVARQRLVRIIAVISLFFFVLSLGPTLKFMNTDTGVSLPYALLMKIPPFSLARGPARFVALGMFFLMVISAYGMSWMQRGLSRRGGSYLGAGAMFLVFAWTVAEAYAPAPPQSIFVPPAELKTIEYGPVLNLPLSRFDGYALLLQMYHHQAIATGYTSRYSAEQTAHVDRLGKLIDKGGPQLCDELAREGFRNIVIAPVSRLEAPFEMSTCILKVVDLRKQVTNFPLYALGTRIDLAAAESERFLFYGWSNREAASRWTDRGRAVIAFALEQLEGTALRIKFSPFLVPGELRAQSVTLKLNGQVIETLLISQPAAREYSIALPKGALQKENTLSFDLPDAESPKSLGAGEDVRLLGISVAWFELD